MSDPQINPECLWLVRSTLSMTAQMKQLYPSSVISLCEIEGEVLSAGQILLAAGSESRARLALEAIHAARRKLGQFDGNSAGFTA